jgi:hypothetical protein
MGEMGKEKFRAEKREKCIWYKNILRRSIKEEKRINLLMISRECG